MIARMGIFRRPGPLSVGTLLTCLVLVPSLTAGWAGARWYAEIAEVRDDGVALGESARGLAATTSLQTALLDEVYFAQAIAYVGALGLDVDFIAEILGYDLVESAEETAAIVDRLAADLGDGVDEIVQEVRDLLDPSMNETIEETFASAFATRNLLRGLVDRRIDALARSGRVFGEQDMLPDLWRLLRTVAEVRLALSDMVDGYFTLLLSEPAERARPLRELGTSLDNYDRGFEDLRARSAFVPEVAVLLDDLVANEAHQRLVGAMREAFDLAAAGSLGVIDLDAPDLEMLSGLANAFEDSATVTDAHLPLVGLSEELIVAAVSDVTADTAAELERARLLLGGAAAFTLLMLYCGARAIRRPLEAVADAADALRDGRSPGPVAVAGPREVRVLARTVNEVAVNLDGLERQASALAEGRLGDDTSLAVPGRLGASLQSAFHRLRSSMTEAEEYRRQLVHTAAHDSLTGLPNRHATIDHLERTIVRAADGSAAAVLFVDLDDFKRVNDAFGHVVGDKVLAETARRLEHACRPGDHVGRIAGDEFLVVAHPAGRPDEVLEIAERIRRAVRAPIALDGITVRMTASVGATLTDELSVAEDLVQNADLALYEAKQHGRDRVTLCDDELRDRVAADHELRRALEVAIEEREFEVWFQPIIDAASGRWTEVEALVRWRRDGHLVPPDEFIPFAEHSDLIIGIDDFVIDAAVEHLAAWSDDPVMGAVDLAVNVSGRHLLHGDLAGAVNRALARHQVPAERLILEITESAMVEDLRAAAETVQLLRLRGVRIAVDDFGTGFMSISHLRMLPVDILKIDRAFTAALGDSSDMALVQLMIEAGHLLGATVVAEGVETEGQLEILRMLGADSLQGYHFQPPVPASGLLAAAMA